MPRPWNLAQGAIVSIEKLAELLTQRNRVDGEIARLVGRPALIGHIGEWIASEVFDIALEPAANARGIDGQFRTGALAGRTVNVKCYGKREGLLDIRLAALPDYYLVLTGPAMAAMSSARTTRPFVIEEVFLFDARRLVRDLSTGPRPVKFGVATSVRAAFWHAARIYPVPIGAPATITTVQAARLKLFSSECCGG